MNGRAVEPTFATDREKGLGAAERCEKHIAQVSRKGPPSASYEETS